MFKDNKNIAQKQERSLLTETFDNFNLLEDCLHLNKEEIDEIASKIQWREIPDSYIAGNLHLIKNMDWYKYVDRMQILRIATRDLENLELYPLHLYQYESEDIIRCARIEPKLLDILNVNSLSPKIIIELSKTHPHLISKIDFNTVSLSHEESVEIAKLGVEEVLKNLIIDINDLSYIDGHKIIKSHNYSYDSLVLINAFDEDFNNSFYIRDILIHTGIEYIDKFHVEYLNPSDWLILIEENSEFINYINIDDFLEGDTFYLIELCFLFPEKLELIDENIASKITSYGWERLFVHFRGNQKLIDLCDFDSLEEKTWNVLSEKRSDLMIFRN